MYVKRAVDKDAVEKATERIERALQAGRKPWATDLRIFW
jgi:hypothetical protein